MSRILLALSAFFRVLFDRGVAERVATALAAGAAPTPVETPPAEKPCPRPATPPPPSDALSLLAALQREGRLVDFLHEPLGDYSDAQIGAAVRDVHRDCAAVLARMFAIEPLETGPEGSELQISTGFDAARYRLVGQVGGGPPYRGKLCHHGWRATRCELPTWTGTSDAALIIAPAEVEIAAS